MKASFNVVYVNEKRAAFLNLQAYSVAVLLKYISDFIFH